MLPVRITLFGSVSLAVDGKPVALRLQSSRKLLALLAIKNGNPVSRNELAETLWPEEDFSVTGNRLRTALAELRSAMKPYAPIAGDSRNLKLEQQLAESDIDLAGRLGRQIRVASDESEEERRLLQLRELLSKDFLADFEDEWAERARHAWHLRRIDVLLRLAEIASGKKEYRHASEFADEVFGFEPYHEVAWMVYLRSMAREGKALEATRNFVDAKRRLASELGGRFGEDLLDLAKAVRDGEIAPEKQSSPLVTSESELLGRVFASVLEESPTSALGLLATVPFQNQVLRSPQSAIRLLDMALAATEGRSDDRLATALVAMRARLLLQHVDEAAELGYWLLENDTNPARRSTVYHMLAFNHFHIREWDDAYDCIDKAIQISVELENENRVQLCKAQWAAFEWHQGRFDQALAQYAEAYSTAAKSSDFVSKIGLASIAANTGIIHLIRGEIELAIEWLGRGRLLAQAGDYSILFLIGDPPLGFAKASLGFLDEGRALIVDALVRAFRVGDRRALEIGLDYAAGALALGGHPAKALAVLELGARLRKERRHIRSVAEEIFADRVRGLAGNAKPDSSWLKLASPKEILMAVAGELTPE